MTVEQAMLPGGMRLVTDRMDSVESVSLGVWVNAGARNETAEINGASHLLEHMAFKGTARRSALDIAVEIENVEDCDIARTDATQQVIDITVHPGGPGHARSCIGITREKRRHLHGPDCVGAAVHPTGGAP